MVKERIKNSKGITLIALIITITILIILTALTVKIIVDGDMIDNTKTAVNDTNNKVEELQNKADKWEEELNIATEENPGIKFTYEPALGTWTNGDVVVTVRLDEPEKYDLEISRDGTTWEQVNTLTYELNGKVYARAVKEGNQVGKTKVGEVTNIDKTSPKPGYIRGYEDAELTRALEEWEGEDGTFKAIYTEGAVNDENAILWVYTEFINGSDDESGIAKTTFQLYRMVNFNMEKSVIAEYVLDDQNTTAPIVKVDYGGNFEEITSRVSGFTGDIAYWVEIVSEDKVGNISESLYRITISYYYL